LRVGLDAAALRQLAGRYFADAAETAAFAAFEAQHRQVAGATATPDAFEAVLLRTLLIHHWRRLVLRHAPLPDMALPEGHPVRRARAFAATLYCRLAPPADTWLDARIGMARPTVRFDGAGSEPGDVDNLKFSSNLTRC
jgi:DNA-binding transcriptional regulator PaaX